MLRPYVFILLRPYVFILPHPYIFMVAPAHSTAPLHFQRYTCTFNVLFRSHLAFWMRPPVTSCFAQHWSRPVSLPPGRVLANVPSDTIQIVKIADDLIEIVPLPNPANPRPS